MVERADPRHVRHDRAAADIDEDARRGQHALADPHDIGAFEARMAVDDGQPSMPRSQFSIFVRALPETVSARALTRFMSILIGLSISDAILGAASRKMRRIGAGDQRLGRHAAGVDAGSAEQMALDQRDLHAGGSQPSSQRGPGLPGPDDDGVESSFHDAGSKMSAVPMASLMFMTATACRPAPRWPLRFRVRHVQPLQPSSNSSMKLSITKTFLWGGPALHQNAVEMPAADVRHEELAGRIFDGWRLRENAVAQLRRHPARASRGTALAHLAVQQLNLCTNDFHQRRTCHYRVGSPEL